MATKWSWHLVTLDVGTQDKDQGSEQVTYAPPAGGSVQRVILTGGISGYQGINHAAPGAARVPTIYHWRYELRRFGGSLPSVYFMRRNALAQTSGYTVDTASGTTTTSMMTWTMPPEFWQWDGDVRFSADSGAELILGFFWQDQTTGLDGVDQPVKAWGGWVDMSILVSEPDV